MRRLILCALLAACGDDHSSHPKDAGSDAPADAARLTGCLEQPGVLPTAPQGQLPCDLVPPGLQL